MNTMGSDSWPVFVAQCHVGRGVFASRDLAAGETVLVFTGPVISLAQALAKGEREGDAFQIGIETYIDTQPPGLFVNHSCEPNTGVMNDTLLIALRDIRQDEELRFDYSTTMFGDSWTMLCRCASPACRGVLGSFETLAADVQERYVRDGLVPSFIRSSIARVS